MYISAIFRVHLFRLRIKFDKYFKSMRDELILAINGIDNEQPTKIIKIDKLKKVSDEIILMILYCLQPTVRSKLSVFNMNKDEKLPEIILRRICKCKVKSIYILLIYII